LIGGHVEILEGAIIGMGAIIHQRLKIPSMVIIGQGAVVIKKTSLWSNGVFVGNPAASIGFREQ
jgi:acetyltransferase-like isoleucine patch superfamily enzyme